MKLGLGKDGVSRSALAWLALGVVLAVAAMAAPAAVIVQAVLVAASVLCLVVAAGNWALARIHELRLHDERLSAELTHLSQSLLRLERGRAPPSRPTQPPTPQREPDLVADLQALSRIVTDLADAVDSLDARLQARECAAAPHVPALGQAAVFVAADPIPSVPTAPRDGPEQGPGPSEWSPETSTRERDGAERSTAMARSPETASMPALAAAARPQQADPATDGLITLQDAPFLEALDRGAVELHIQPAVTLPQRRPHLHEVLARLRLADERIVLPAEFVPSFERLGLMPALDEAVLKRALAIADQVAAPGGRGLIAVNLSTASLTQSLTMEVLEARLAEQPGLGERVVLEMAQTAWDDFGPRELAVLARLQAKAITFSIDHVFDWSADWVGLAARGVAFVKIPARDLLDLHGTTTLPRRLAILGIRLVAERVEDERIIPDLIELDVPYAQGYALVPPRPARDLETLEASPRAPDASPSETAHLPLSYRDYLRRTG